MGSWQTGLFKTGDKSSADIAMRKQYIEDETQALLQFEIKVDCRKYVRADMACRLVKRDDPSMTYRSRCSHYRGYGVKLVVENVAADRSVEWRTLGESLVRSYDELNLSKSGSQRSGLRRFDG